MINEKYWYVYAIIGAITGWIMVIGLIDLSVN